MSKLYFFRHAQASYGATNYDQLSQKGEQQSAILGEYLVNKKINFDKIYVGPLKRQQHTFEIVADIFSKNKRQLPEPIHLYELKEHSGPAASRAALPNLIKKNPQLKKWYEESNADPQLKKRNSLLMFDYFMDEWTAGNINVENIESWADFRKRVTKGLDIILENTGRSETIAAFTSGGTISSITATALNMQDEKRVAAMNFFRAKYFFYDFPFFQK